VPDSPAFGQADLTNCERELIHLAGSIQPQGLLLVLDEPDLRVLQASLNTDTLLGVAAGALLGRPLAGLGGDLAERLHQHLSAALETPVPVTCSLAPDGRQRAFEGNVHRHPGGGLILELEPVGDPAMRLPTAEIDHATLMQGVATAVQRFSSAASLPVLVDAVAQCVHDLTGYDRVMVYKFDPDGHGKIIAEARDPRLESLLGHHYPATDIPQRARALYLRNRVRVLVDVHYEPVPLVPRLLPSTGQELDMSLCDLRSMSPLHLQYLKNMGVTATLVVSLVREGRLWGLIAAHHYSPRHLRQSVRAACDLLSEVISTRIAAIETYAHAQVAILVRRLEQRLVEATSVEGDWRLALFRNPRTLLQPLEATGAALFHGGEILTCGDAPSTPELRALQRWIEAQEYEPPFACSSVSKANPALQSLTPTASGVLAVRLSTTQSDHLMWFRKEQLLTVTWAGDPNKPLVDDNPLELSPRRSFAAWSEIVRGTALPWSGIEIALARAIGVALVDIIVQVHGVRLLIAEHQLVQIRETVQSSHEPVAIVDVRGRLLFSNRAFDRMVCADGVLPTTLDELALRFTQPQALLDALQGLQVGRQPWRGGLALRSADGQPLPVGLRAEVVPGRDGNVLGYIVILDDLSDSQRAAAARRHLEQSLQPSERDADVVIRAILTNASLAAMDITDGPGGPTVAPLLNEVEASAQRASALYKRIRSFGEGG
jgi:light-regulated signal transduction histidine kinase (bacteriophytochrome)